LAREYVGRAPSAVESAGVLIKLHSAPMYFYRRGRGRFQAAPQETLKLARAELLYAPDGNKPETKALDLACKETGLTPAKLFERCGLLPDSHDHHLKRFLHEFFPQGTGFPAHELPPPAAGLPLAAVKAFSLNDTGTTEIDDAFSLERRGDGVRVGIHIAAPGLGLAPQSPLDAIARGRL